MTELVLVYVWGFVMFGLGVCFVKLRQLSNRKWEKVRAKDGY